jgi:hypothetical protein
MTCMKSTCYVMAILYGEAFYPVLSASCVSSRFILFMKLKNYILIKSPSLSMEISENLFSLASLFLKSSELMADSRIKK